MLSSEAYQGEETQPLCHTGFENQGRQSTDTDCLEHGVEAIELIDIVLEDGDGAAKNSSSGGVEGAGEQSKAEVAQSAVLEMETSHGSSVQLQLQSSDDCRRVLRSANRTAVLQPSPCPSGGPSAASKRSRKRKTNPKKREHKCPECHKVYTHEVCLQKHMKVHKVERTHRCKECGKVFLRRDRLITHMSIHSPEKPRHHDECSKPVLRRDHPITHAPSHLPEKPRQCYECSNPFLRRDYLITHTPSHSPEKPRHWDECGKPFLRRDHLITHTPTHSTEKPRHSHECGKPYRHEESQKVHETRHGGRGRLSCPRGRECLEQGYGLKRHFRNHASEKRYAFASKTNSPAPKLARRGRKKTRSSVGGSRHRRKSHARRHGYTHSGQKAFFRVDRHGEFTRSGRLVRHRKASEGC